MTSLTTAKVITFNRDTKDFDASFDGNYIGSFATYSQAENELNQHVLLLCEQGLLDAPLAALAEQALVAANPVAAFDRSLIPSADWGAYATDDINTCACGAPAAILLHGVHDTFDIALCYRCHGAYCSMDWPDVIQALDPDEPPGGDPWPDGLMLMPDGLMLMPEGDILDTDGMRVSLDYYAAKDATEANGHPRRTPPDAGAPIARQFHRDRHRFLAVLANLDRDAWRVLAECYVAYMSRTGSWITPDHILRIWAKAVNADIVLPPRSGPPERFTSADEGNRTVDAICHEQRPGRAARRNCAMRGNAPGRSDARG